MSWPDASGQGLSRGCHRNVDRGCLQSPEGLTGATGAPHKSPVQLAVGKRAGFLAGWWSEASVPPHAGLLEGCPQHSSWLALEWW